MRLRHILAFDLRYIEHRQFSLTRITVLEFLPDRLSLASGSGATASATADIVGIFASASFVTLLNMRFLLMRPRARPVIATVSAIYAAPAA